MSASVPGGGEVSAGGGGEQPRPRFDPAAPHHQRPKIRKVRGFPLQAKGPEGKQVTLLGLADAQQISSKVVATMPAVQVILPHLDGQKTIDEVVDAVGKGLKREMLEQVVAQLDEAGLIYGPTYEEMAREMRAQFDGADVLPPGTTAQVADQLVLQKLGDGADDEQKAELGPKELTAAMDTWIDQALKDAEQPAFDVLPAAMVAPHIDYPRGWMNYAQVYGRLRTTPRPDRVVILGTNHFGESTGVCGCDKGFQTPLGTSPLARDLFDAVCNRLGEDGAAKLLEHRYDHEREHSIELQMPWIQHCLGADESGAYVPVFAALVHDPAVNNGESYDGQGLALDPFVEALRAALDEVGGTTLVISSADLSHVGPAFGDKQALAGDAEEARSARERVAAHDREMLQLVTDMKADELVASMAWQQNPTRWCSVGNMVAAMGVVRPESVELLNYAAAMDPKGTTMVSHAALAMR